MSLDLLLILMALALGLALSQTRLCTVQCTYMLILAKRPDGFLRLGIATSATAIVLLALAWLAPWPVALPHDAAISWPLVLGGALLGVGAFVNDACYLGTITYLSTGRVSFLFTLIGIAVGGRFVPRPWGPQLAVEHDPRLAVGTLGACRSTPS